MRIVVITGSFYPSITPPANCFKKYIDKLREKHNITILCQQSNFKKAKVTHDGLNLYEVTNYINTLRCIAYQSSKWYSNILNKFVRAIGFFQGLYMFPSRNSWLINKYADALNIINNESKIDLIISVSHPFCTHLAALEYKNTHPEVGWISFTTDPFPTGNYLPRMISGRYFSNKAVGTEIRVFSKADYNIFTEELIGHALDTLKLDNKKCVAFPYVLTDFSSNIQKRNNRNNERVLIYAGALNKEIRNPEFALSVLRRICNVKVEFYQTGDCDDLFDKYSCPHVERKQTVSRNEYIDLILNKSDILINIGNNSLTMSPSKMLELISTGKPIINFYVYKNSQFEMLEKYPKGINIGKDDINPILKLQTFCDSVNCNSISFEEIKLLFPNNCLDRQMPILEQVINKLAI